MLHNHFFLKKYSNSFQKKLKYYLKKKSSLISVTLCCAYIKIKEETSHSMTHALKF